MKNHKEKYRLERIIRIQSKWSFGKATNANNRKHYSIRWSFYQPIYQFASLWDSMPTTSDSSMKKGCHLRIVSRVISSATVEPSLLYGTAWRIFLSLLTTKVWECKNGSLDFWGVVWAFGLLHEGFKKKKKFMKNGNFILLRFNDKL